MTETNNIKHKLLLHPTLYKAKPNEKEIRRKKTGINDSITKYAVEITAEELAIAITKGQTWIAGYIEEKRCNDNWKSQSIFALDFDNSEPTIDANTGKPVKDPITKKILKKQVNKPINFEQVLNRLKEYGLGCTFAYYTFSHTNDWHKFRVVFQLSKPVADDKARDKVQLALLYIFPEADKCKDACRLWYGTNNGLITSNYEYYLEIPTLIDNGIICSASNTDKSNVARKIKSTMEKLDFDEKWLGSISNKGNAYNSSIINNSKITNTKTYHYFFRGSQYCSDIYSEILRNGYLSNIDFAELADKVKILSDFMNSNIKLTHEYLKGIATNLYWIEGGQSLFSECIDANPEYDQAKHNIIVWCRQKESIPMNLKDFSPYEEDWEYINLLQVAKIPKGEVIRKKIYKPMKLDKAEYKLDKTFDEFDSDTGNSIWVVKKATGLGGTRRLLSRQNSVICFPNHDLKDEVAKDFKVPYISTPKIPLDSVDEKLRENIEYLFKLGLYEKAYGLIRKEAVNYPSLNQFLELSMKAPNINESILTTHSKGVHINFSQYNVVIFDENPLSSVLEIGEIFLDDLCELTKIIVNLVDKENLNKYLDILSSTMSNSIEVTKEFIFEDIEAIEEIVLRNKVCNSNILNFFSSQFYVKDCQFPRKLNFIKHNSLNSVHLINKKIMILSSTASEFFYKQLYGDRVKFIDLSNVEMEGILVQDTHYSYSRSSLNQSTVRKRIEEKVSNIKHLLTFKPYKHYFENAVENLHYGKCTGSNELSGERIAVVGTPHQPYKGHLNAS
jgi:hypothetical protein